ncbi:hypothetical protein ABZ722_01625 [Streptomyces longwoodensis]|jgi:hypothetical protein|uniref:hypothetical protein n=1 Tax=Streptomyces longwoodensis TaxID=68231 RepID=UPI002E81F7AC|nr:hypothetical protein [Streptomyces longwoodensis]WUC60693.1 hypothetical protein OHA09_28195 [Streptomyces longwoodensis]WUC74227.1 hypothetical protein OG416_27195 [Streptomyces longwoodensis]
MPTLTLPRPHGSRVGATVLLTALAASGASFLAAPAAVAQGEAGDIRVHREHVPFGVSKDDPLVCRFYLDAVNFDTLPTIAYTILAQPPLPTAATVTGTIPLAGGAGHTDPLGLADGQYKITWIVAGVPKEKVFRVNCHDGKREGEQGPGEIQDKQGDAGWGQGEQDGPKGGVHAGGGGLVDTAAAYSPVAAAAGVGAVAVGAALYVRKTRRRTHGAA